MMNPPASVLPVKETEVLAKAKRRRFTAEYKERILKEVGEARASGQSGAVGAILRREGLYSSHLAVWQRQLEEGGRAGLEPKRRGPKPRPVDPRAKEIAQLRKEKAMVELRLKRAEALLEVQKKSPSYWGSTCLPLRTTRRPRETRNGGIGLPWHRTGLQGYRSPALDLLSTAEARAWPSGAAGPPARPQPE